MRKKFLLLAMLFLLVGCSNPEERVKGEYIAVRNQILSETNYEMDLPLSIVVTFDRVDGETITYQVVLKEPMENMHHIKAMVVHNYSNEDVFPSVGLFEKEEELFLDSEKTIDLVGNIETTKDLRELNLRFKIWIAYQTDTGEKKEVYYKV